MKTRPILFVAAVAACGWVASHAIAQTERWTPGGNAAAQGSASPRTSAAEPGPPGRWVSRGPDGWAEGSLTIDPSNSSVLYATTRRGLYRSLDGGQSWTLLYPASDPFRSHRSGFTVESRDPRHLLLATDTGFAQSRDGGATWTLTAPPAPPPFRPQPLRFFILEFDAFNSEVIYAAAHVGGDVDIHSWNILYKTEDAGLTWIPVFETFPSVETITSLVSDHVIPGAILVGTTGPININRSGLYASIDGGKNWSGGMSRPVNSIVQDPGSFSVYVSTGDGQVWKLEGARNQWRGTTQSVLPGSSPLLYNTNSLVMAPSNPREVFANTPGGIYRSDDEAKTWRQVASSELSLLAVDPNLSETIYLREGNRLLKSPDGGITQADAFRGLIAPATGLLVTDPRSPSVIWTTGTSEIFVTGDGARTWSRKFVGLPAPGGAASLAIDASSSSVLYAAVGSAGVFKTIDGGDHWNASASGLTEPVSVVAADSRIRGLVYAIGQSSGEMFRTQDGADSWTKVAFQIASSSARFTVDPSTAGVVYLASNVGAFRSTDSGSTWTRLPGIGGVSQIAVDPVDSARIYLVTDGEGILRSLDRGETWSNLGLKDAVGLAIDPKRPNRLYAAVQAPASPFQSLDAGATWTPIGDGLPPDASASLAVVASGTVYASTNGFGVYSFEPLPDRPDLQRGGSRAGPRVVPGRR